MKLQKIASIFMLFSMMLWGEGKHFIFVLDGSGSMSGVPLYQAKDAMLKTAKEIFKNSDKIMLMIPEDMKEVCDDTLRLETKFFSTLKELEEILLHVEEGGYNNIPIGFEHAQAKMAKNHYKGHIYMFGDCDGLELCNTGIKIIATKYSKRKELTPFTYMQVNGCNGAEIRSWNETLKTIGGKTGVAKTFNYEKISANRREAIQRVESYFVHPKFINKDASLNNGKSYKNRPWRCVESDGLFWLTITKEEQNINFYIQKNEKPHKNNLWVNEYLDKLNVAKSCGEKRWRLPDIFELSRLTQLGTKRRKELFPYLKNWAHISTSGGKYMGFKKGVDFNNAEIYDYREDRPYATIFVSGGIDKTLFTLPSNYLTQHESTAREVVLEDLNTLSHKAPQKVLVTEVKPIPLEPKELKKPSIVEPKTIENSVKEESSSRGYLIDTGLK